MNLVDFIILFTVIIILSLIVYFSIRKKSESACDKCAYNKKCSSKEKTN